MKHTHGQAWTSLSQQLTQSWLASTHFHAMAPADWGDHADPIKMASDTAAATASDLIPPYSRAVWKRGDVRRQVL